MWITYPQFWFFEKVPCYYVHMESIGDVLKNHKYTPPKRITRKELISKIYARLRHEASEDRINFPDGKNGWMMVARQLKRIQNWRLSMLAEYDGKLSPIYWREVKNAPKPEPKKSNKKFKF